MECPYCGKELRYKDYYGRYLGNDNWDKKGEIYQCDNEECEFFDEYFHTDPRGYFKEGYPC